MPTFTEAADVPASRQDVFALVMDVAARTAWDPTVASAEILDGATRLFPGVRVLMVCRRGPSLELETSDVEPPELIAAAMCDGPWYLYHYSLKWMIGGALPERSHVMVRCRLRTWPAFLRFAMEPLVCRFAARRLRRRLLGLRAHFVALRPPDTERPDEPESEPLPPELLRRSSRRRGA